MKKIIMIVIAVLAVFVLTGCKDDSLHSKYPGLKPGQKLSLMSNMMVNGIMSIPLL